MITKKELKELFASFLFTKRCVFCGRVIDIRKRACPECEGNKCEIIGEICLKCGCLKSECSCDGQIRFYKAVAAPFYYDGAAGMAVRRMKFERCFEAGEYLAAEAARCFNERFKEYSFEYVTSVPVTEKEYKSKGFNQSEFLAKRVAELTEIEYAPLLDKLFDTKPQHTLRDNERSGNLLGVFAVKEELKAKIENARVLIVDDVKTTGATLDECAKTLLVAGAAEVFCLTAAVARKKRSDNLCEKEDNDEIF